MTKCFDEDDEPIYYITVADVRNYIINCAPVNLGACSDEHIQEEIAVAHELIDLITNDTFCPFTATYTFDGNGKCRLQFPPKVPYKLLSVTEVLEFGCGYPEAGKAVTSYTAGPHWIDRCCSTACDAECACWPKGCNSVSIEGSWGWAETPVMIKKAAKLLVLERLSPGSCGSCNAQKYPPNTQTVDWGDFKISFQPEKTQELLSGSSTGIIEVDMILSHYINRVDMFIDL